MQLDPKAAVFGLPASLHIPIAAADPDAIEQYAAEIITVNYGRSGRPNVLKVRPARRTIDKQEIGLWQHPATVPGPHVVEFVHAPGSGVE